MSYQTAEECRDYYDDLMAAKQHVVDECESAMRSLNVAYDYLEEIISGRDSGDYLPSASSLSVDLVERQALIWDRIGEREEMKIRAEISIENLEDERDSEVESLELLEQQREEAEEALDDIEDTE